MNWDWLDADWVPWGEAALAALLLSGLAAWGEHRRRNRADIDAVGLVPWRDVAAITSFAGLLLTAIALLRWVRG
jgi:hypothetical protein